MGGAGMGLTNTEKSHACRPDAFEELGRFQLDMLCTLGLDPDDQFLDFGCGPLCGGACLIDYLEDGCYHGIDCREIAIEIALRHLRLNGQEADIRLVGDIETTDLGQRFDFIWAFTVLIHITDPRPCFGFVRRHLADGGRFVCNVIPGADVKPRVWHGFPLVKRSPESYVRIGSENGLKATTLGTSEQIGHVMPVPSARDQVFIEFSA